MCENNKKQNNIEHATKQTNILFNNLLLYAKTKKEYYPN